MAKRMLIDATQPEETRVSVVSGNRLEEYDFETASKKQLKGNIYLAKVVRVEPSLQAAFVDYGGNRHGFLAFSEIHPDYYRIPVEDRAALVAEEREFGRAEDRVEALGLDAETSSAAVTRPATVPEVADSSVPSEPMSAPATEVSEEPARVDDGAATDEGASDEFQQGTIEIITEEAPPEEIEPEDLSPVELGSDEAGADEVAGGEAIGAPYEPATGEPAPYIPSGFPVPLGEMSGDETNPLPSPSDLSMPVLGGDGGLESGGESGGETETPAEMRGEMPTESFPESPEADAALRPEGFAGDDTRRRRPQSRRYKIQEVIKRRQVMLVQVTKEERGTKGAALTTRLSLAGRYCVLMPNTGRGGGISRKIDNAEDRKRLREIVDGIEIPEGISVIVRTAGAKRTKAEIKRDFDYLLRLWSDVRELTLKSTAPALIYEEANLIKRSIRDLYARDMEDIEVEGEDAYKAAKEFMRTLMPSHAKRVKLYRSPNVPLFQRYQIESQIAAIHQPITRLKSGGYIVINQTEALVAIDVNSGRATRERNIEETATQTNLEAADEIARQLRLRDLAGLIVIDYIDMEHQRNQRAVEKRLKDALKNDRARIQLGRISHFGLLEMSRQRLRPSLHEFSTERCAHCQGTGVVRSVESAALQILRAIEEEGLKKRSAEIVVAAPPKVSLFILNQKRAMLTAIEGRHYFRVFVNEDATLVPPDFRVEVTKSRTPAEAEAMLEAAREMAPQPAPEPEIADEAEPEEDLEAVEAEEPEDRAAETAVEYAATESPHAEGASDQHPHKRRRRGKRGGRRRRGGGQGPGGPQNGVPHQTPAANHPSAQAAPAEPDHAEPAAFAAPLDESGPENRPGGRRRRRRRRGRGGGNGHQRDHGAPSISSETPAFASESSPAVEPAQTDRPRAERTHAERAHEPKFTEQRAASEPAPERSESEKPSAPKRRGWWQRLVE
jgi:ribonuclease E